MERLRQIIQHGLRKVDGLYRLLHRLQPVGEVLYVGAPGIAALQWSSRTARG